MITVPPPRRNNAAEIQAFDAVCDRLAGFDDGLSLEHIDGLLASLAAAPRVPEPAEWLPALLGDTFERVFADPADAQQGLAALQARLRVLCDQLDPQALFDDPEAMRLEPWCNEWDDAARQELIAEQGASAEEAALMQTGADWADGFLHGVQALPALWATPPGEPAAEAFGDAFNQIGALVLPVDGEELQQHIARYYPDRKGDKAPTRDDLLAEACMSIQDLRMYWVDFAAKPETRRVEATPGRNDPCPCGSGKKYKKCHGGQ